MKTYELKIIVDSENKKLSLEQGTSDPNAIVAVCFNQTLAIIQQTYNKEKEQGTKTSDLASLLKTIHVLGKFTSFYEDAAFEEAEKEVSPLKAVKDTDIN